MPHKHFTSYQRQTRVKHLILGDYLAAWVTILGSRHDRLQLMDGFCGPGTYDDEDGEHDGSPLIAVRIAESAKHRTRLDCLFTDTSAASCRALRQHLDTLGVGHEVKPGDFDTIANELLDNLDPRTPSFFFVDPCGWSGYPMKTIERIMDRRRSEVLINFMYNAINEWLTAPGTDASFENLFDMQGEDLETFRDNLDTMSAAEREQAIRDRYITELRKRGRYVFPFKVKFPGKDRTYYYLIHATNSFKGLEVMKGVMYKAAGHTLEYAALGREDSQLSLFNEEPTTDDLANYLLDAFGGRTETFTGVMEESYQYTPFIEKHYRAAVKAMAKGGRVTITQVDSKRKGAVRGRDRITFGQHGR